jgi:hypothetical protein
MNFTTFATIAIVYCTVLYRCIDKITATSESYISSIINSKQHQHRPWRKEEYPIPSIDTMRCRSHSSLLCDPDSILNTTEIQQLEFKVQSFQNQIHVIEGANSIQITIYTALIRKVRRKFEWQISFPHLHLNFLVL